MSGGREADAGNQGGREEAEGAQGGGAGAIDAGERETGGGEEGGATAHSNTAWVREGSGVALEASLPEAGPSLAPPQKPEQTTKGVDWGPGIVILEKNCAVRFA